MYSRGIKPEDRREDCRGQISGLLWSEAGRQENRRLAGPHPLWAQSLRASNCSAVSLEGCTQPQLPSAGRFPRLSSTCRGPRPLLGLRIGAGVRLVEIGMRPDVGHFWGGTAGAGSTGYLREGLLGALLRSGGRVDTELHPGFTSGLHLLGAPGAGKHDWQWPVWAWLSGSSSLELGVQWSVTGTFPPLFQCKGTS